MDMRRAMIIGESNNSNPRPESRGNSNEKVQDNHSRDRSRSREAQRPSRGKNFVNNNYNSYNNNGYNNQNNYRGQQNFINTNKYRKDENQGHSLSLNNITNLPNGNNSSSMGNVDELKQFLDDPAKFNSKLQEFQNQLGSNNNYNHPNQFNKKSHSNLSNPSFDENNQGHSEQGEMPNQGENGEIMKVRLELQGSFRHARRLYIGNIPDMITVDYLTEWLYRSLEAAGGLLEPGNPVLNTKIDPKGQFAFIEMRSIEETSSMLGLDGIILWNRSLRIRRPTEYEKFPAVEGTRPIPKLDLSLLETIGIVIIPTQVGDNDNQLFMANLPTVMDELTIMDVLKLKDYGKLKAFHLVKDSATNQSKGYAFLEFEDPSVTQKAINGLNQFNLYGRAVTCQRASVGPQPSQEKQIFINPNQPINNEPHGKNYALNELNNMMKHNYPGALDNNNNNNMTKQKFL